VRNLEEVVEELQSKNLISDSCAMALGKNASVIFVLIYFI
jgi:hypothetical protein